jgi:integrase/DNA-binding transcriptional regulator YhcF (GntR family)
LNQVDEKRNPKTRATVDQLIAKYFEVLDVDTQTMRGYRSKYKNHIKPLIGSQPLTRLDIEILDSFYAELRTCRDHCRGRKYVQHRTDRPHQCDEHVGDGCPRNNPEGCRRCRRLCKPHVCKGLGASTIRQIHWILSGALDRAVVWKWISVNPAEQADKPGLPTPNPQPPTAEQVSQLILAAWDEEPDWGTFLWLKATTGNRRGEMCALRWDDREPRPDGPSVLKVERSLFLNDDGKLEEKDTKTHQHRRLVLDPDTDAVLDEQEARARRRADAVGVEFDPHGFQFSPVPDGSGPMNPTTVSRRYARLAKGLGIDTSLKNMRHYNATELIMADVNLKTVAGRLGHGGGGTTTLRVYTAWHSEADQRAAGPITARMPPRPTDSGVDKRPEPAPLPGSTDEGLQAYQRIAADLRGAIDSGILMPGDPLPTEKALAARYEVAASTAHRAVALLVAAGLAQASRGVRATVAAAESAINDEQLASVTVLKPSQGA